MDGMIPQIRVADDWLQTGSVALREHGVFVLTGVLTQGECDRYSEACLSSMEVIRTKIGLDRLTQAGELGVARFPPKYSAELYGLLDVSVVHQLVERVISGSAIAHLMNAICLPPGDPTSLEVFQGRLHRDFPRSLNGFVLSVNAFYCLSDFVPETGSTRFVVGSHQCSDPTPPGDETAQAISAPAGSVVFFDSTIWHAGGINRSDKYRVGVNTQWTPHWVKQQIDLVRYVGAREASRLPERVQRALGMHSRVVTSLEEYYVAPEERLYRPGQG